MSGGSRDDLDGLQANVMERAPHEVHAIRVVVLRAARLALVPAVTRLGRVGRIPVRRPGDVELVQEALAVGRGRRPCGGVDGWNGRGRGERKPAREHAEHEQSNEPPARGPPAPRAPATGAKLGQG